MALRSGGTRVDRGGVVMKRFLRTRTTVLVGASALALSALISAPAHAAVSGSLSGWHSPAGGPKPPDGPDPSVLNLVVAGRSDGTDLRRHADGRRRVRRRTG